MKKVIVYLSTYNGEKYLRENLDSIYAQTYPCFDFYVRDDGSKDGTVEILREYQAKAPKEKPLIMMNDLLGDWSNRGAHQSYNELIRNLPKADVYMSLDQDDAWLPEKVERTVAAISKYPEDVPVLSIHNYYVCNSNLEIQGTMPPLRSYTPEELRKMNLAKVIMTGTWASVGMAQSFNDALKQLTYHKGEFERSIALDCWVGWVVAGCKGALEYDPEPLVYYRRHEGVYSAGGAAGLAQYADWKKHMTRHCNNIKNGIHWYRKLYYELLTKENQDFLDLFDSNKHIRKAFYPHRMRDKLLHEIAFRVLLLAGKI